MVLSRHTAIKDTENKITQLFTKYRSLMIYIAKEILKDYHLAEDAVSDSFVKLHRNLHKVGDVDCHKTRGLMVIMARNAAIDIYNKSIKGSVNYEDEMADIPDSSHSVSDEVLGIDGYNNIVDILNSLPDTLRDVADLAFIHKYDYKEIAELLGISYDNVRKRISRAKSVIKSKLKGNKN